MARVVIDPDYEPFVGELEFRCRAAGIRLTEHATGLLRLAAEAWMEDPVVLKLQPPTQPKVPRPTPPPPLPSPEWNTPEGRRGLALKILDHTVREPHIRTLRERGQPVPFHVLLFALAQSGKDRLQEFIEKGF
jgi:hypothetical protein